MDKIGRSIFAAAAAIALGCFGFVQHASAEYWCNGTGEVLASCTDGSFEFGWMGNVVHGSQRFIATSVNAATNCNVFCDVSAAFYTSEPPFSAVHVPPGYYENPVGAAPASMAIGCWCE
jgi:hypothetical protein